jgi:hypothetical protein
MGARTNYTIITTDNPDQNINVYAHWDGDMSEFILRDAITKAMPRIKMNDISYATRIIIDQLTKEGRDSETGYGIYVGADITHEEQYTHKEVDMLTQIVTIGNMSFPFDIFISALV